MISFFKTLKKSNVEEIEYKPNHIDKEFSSYKYDNELIASYVLNRLIPQIKWYDSRSQQKQTRYKWLMGFSLSFGALVPVLTGFREYFYINGLIAALGGTASVLLAIINLNEYQKLWIQYRTNCEILKSNLHRFSLGIGDYKCENQNDSFEKLVISCEDYLLQEFRSWNAITSNKDSEH